jgi:hypothetical protein
MIAEKHVRFSDMADGDLSEMITASNAKQKPAPARQLSY